MLSIKEIAEKMGLNPNAVRFYEKKGLLSPKRTDANYRLYSKEDMARLEMIMLYRKMGFSIEDIQMLLSNQRDHMEQFALQYSAVNYHIRSMEQIRETLGGCIEKQLNGELLEEDLVEQITQTARTIAMTENWKDQWGFDNQASYYDTMIRESGLGLDFYRNYDQVLARTASKVRKGVVMEIGIGTGNLAKVILDTTKGIEAYIGIDQSLNMLKEARKKCQSIRLRKGDFLNLPMEANSCDCLVTSYAFHHCDEEEKKLAIKEIDRVLKKNGSIIIADLMFLNQSARKQYESSCRKEEIMDLEDEFFGNVDEVMDLLQLFGFVCTAEQVDDLVWVIQAEK